MLPINTKAQEVFKPVDNATAERALSYNQRFVSERLYFAKRHRVVEVDADALRKSKRSNVTLFKGGQRHTIRRRQLTDSQIHGAARWIGNIELPGLHLSEDELTADEVEAISNSGLTLDQINSQLGRVELFLLDWDINQTTGEAVLSAERRSQTLGPSPVPTEDNNAYNERAFATISGEIDLSAVGGGVYKIEPLKYSPRYHLIYEVDKSKTFGIVEPAPETGGAISEAQRKKRAFDEYVSTLPAEPKRKVIGGRL